MRAFCWTSISLISLCILVQICKAGQKINPLCQNLQTCLRRLFYVQHASSSACKQGAVHLGSSSERRLLCQQLYTNASWYSRECTTKTNREEKILLNEVVVFVFFAHKKYSRSFIKLQLTDVTWTILKMSLLPFWALNVSVALMFM